MTRVLCRLGLHAWKPPGQWVTYTNDGVRHVRGTQRCGRGSCLASRVYFKSWAPKHG